MFNPQPNQRTFRAAGELLPITLAAIKRQHKSTEHRKAANEARRIDYASRVYFGQYHR